ncbi:MAG: transposase [Desulfomonilaceae bacterium]
MFCLPLVVRLWWLPKATVKRRGFPYKKKPELALDLIKQTHSWLEDKERLSVLADLGYSCDTVLKGRPKGIHITGRLRGDSPLFGLVEPEVTPRRRRPRKRGYRLPTPGTMFKDRDLKWNKIRALCYGKEINLMVYQFTALWYHSAAQEAVSVLLCVI